MAQITNGQDGAGFLAVNIDVLRKEAQEGFIERNDISMNGDLGLVWARVSYILGDTEFFYHEVLLHSLSLIEWPHQIRDMLEGRAGIQHDNPYGYERVLHFDFSSPELIMTLRQHGYLRSRVSPNPHRNRPPRLSFRYELMVAANVGISAENESTHTEGPALLLEPKIQEVLKFAYDLRSETKMALLLDQVLPDDAEAE